MSSRAEFLAVLRAGLRDLPRSEVEEVVADYTAHFTEGTAAGRSEADIAAALGDPMALAGELCAETRIARWHAAPSVRSGLQVISLAAALCVSHLSLLLLGLPLLLLALATVLAILSCIAGGVWMLLAGWSLSLPGGLAVVLLGGVGLLAAGIAITALATLAARLLIDGLGRYFRLQYQLLPRGSRAGTSS